MKVRDAMVPLKECVGPNDRASTATQVMDVTASDILPVVDHSQLSDLVEKGGVKSAVDAGRAPQLLTVRDVMSTHSVCASEEEDLEGARARMKAAGLSAIPVVDAEKKILGMLHQAS